MHRSLLIAGLTAALASSPIVTGDPLHRIAHGEYWHHDSGWIFPERIGEFVRIGVPQDVAGMPDAVASYARALDGARVVTAVDVFPKDSAAEHTTLEAARAALIADVRAAPGKLTEDALPVGKDLTASRVLFMPEGDAPAQALYFVSAGEWRVRIRATVPAAARDVLQELDAFTRAQRWDTLH
jgi:hypothetical protein